MSHLIGVLTRMRFFAPTNVIATAEAVVRAITEALSKSLIPIRF